jgi:hypothetical protein
VNGIARTARWAGGALAGLGVRDLAGILVVIVIVVVALCWVLRDEERTRRLAEIIRAWRGDRARSGRAVAKDAGRRRGQTPGAPGPPVLPGGGTAGAG